MNTLETTADARTILPTPLQTPWQQSTELDSARCAVVVIDLLGGEAGAAAGLEEVAHHAESLVKAARKANIPVLFVNDAHIPGLDRELELWGDHSIRNTPSATPLAQFDLQDTDFVIPKRRYDGFFQTDLDLTLRELGVDTLIVCGFDTNICVLHTLASAFFLGYRSVVAADACGTLLIGTQKTGLEYFSRCYDSRVVTTQTIIEALAR